jgi:YD repeat-containing protein
VTLFSNFDENGRVGTIKRPNGATTSFLYFPRGWLVSSSNEVDGVTEVTSYEYDGVGQLKKLTLSDRTFLSYIYDDAHRLVGISDVLGNSTQYKLDIRGNIVSEQINDPNGVLTRQISRVFDINNAMTKLIGGAQ